MPHLKHLDGLRALAALYVINFHALLQNHLNTGSFPLAGRLLASLFQFGHYAVDLFIVLSGFCLMLPVLQANGVLRGGALRFYRRRALRILPSYFLAMSLSLILIATCIGRKTGTLWDSTIPVTLRGLMAHILLVQDLFQDTLLQINHAFWSISVEWRIYFLFPLLVHGWRRFNPFVTTGAALLGGYALLFVLQRTPLVANPYDIAGIMPQYIGLFALGMLGAGIASAREEDSQAYPALYFLRQSVAWLPVTLLLMVTVLVLSKLRLWHGSILPVAIVDTVVGLGGAALLIEMADDRSRLRSLIGCRPLAFMGTFAYSIYLLHAPLLQLIWQYLLAPNHVDAVNGFYLQCLFGGPLIIGCSYLFFLVAERPFLHRRRPHTMDTREDGQNTKGFAE